jgi:hypothetical protein
MSPPFKTSAAGNDRTRSGEMGRWGWKKVPVPIPEASKFDRMSESELFMALEASLGDATFMTDRYSTVPDERAQTLSLLLTELETAVASTKALIRKYTAVGPL